MESRREENDSRMFHTQVDTQHNSQ